MTSTKLLTLLLVGILGSALACSSSSSDDRATTSSVHAGQTDLEEGKSDLDELGLNPFSDTDLIDIASTKTFLPAEEAILPPRLTEAEQEARLALIDNALASLENAASQVSGNRASLASSDWIARLYLDMLLGQTYTNAALMRLLMSPLGEHVSFDSTTNAMTFEDIPTDNNSILDFVSDTATKAELEATCQALIDAICLITGLEFELDTIVEIDGTEVPISLNVSPRVKAFKQSALYYYIDAAEIIAAQFAGSDDYNSVTDLVDDVKLYLKIFEDEIKATASSEYGFTQVN